MPRPTSFDRVCCPKAAMSCHARRCRPCVQSKGDNVMPRPTLMAVVLSKGGDVMPRSTLTTMCVVQGQWYHATLDVVRSCVLPKGDDGMPRASSFDCVCCPMAMMAYHARRRPTVSAAQRR